MRSYSFWDLSDPSLLLMLQVLLVRRMATGADIQVEGEQVDDATVMRVIEQSPTPKLALICDHLIPLVDEGDREKYGELFINLIGRPKPMNSAFGQADTPRLLETVPDGDLQSACARLGQIWSVDPASLVGDPFDRSRALALLEVWESVGDLHQAEENARSWPREALSATGFDGKTPLEVMQTGLAGLLLVRDFLRDVLQRDGFLPQTWHQDNAEAIEAYNTRIEAHGTFNQRRDRSPEKQAAMPKKNGPGDVPETEDTPGAAQQE